MIEWCKRLSDRKTIEIDRANDVCGTDKKIEKNEKKIFSRITKHFIHSSISDRRK
jgi:hypothetical protein